MSACAIPPAWLEPRPWLHMRSCCAPADKPTRADIWTKIAGTLHLDKDAARAVRPAQCILARQAASCYRQTSALWRQPVYSSDLFESLQRTHWSVAAAHHAATPGADGAGQLVAVVDVGAANFLFFNVMPGGLPKVIVEFDLRDSAVQHSTVGHGEGHSTVGHGESSRGESGRAAAEHACAPRSPLQRNDVNATALGTLGGACSFERDYNNHVVKTSVMAYWAAIDAAREHNGTAPGVSLISLRFADNLYIIGAPRQQQRGGADSRAMRSRAPYLRGLVRALRWVAAHAAARNVTAVQLSAIDGLYEDGPAVWKANEPSLYAEFAAGARTLRAMGVWVSAPTGNSGDAALDPIDRVSWPASDPHIFAVGCASLDASDDASDERATPSAAANWSHVAGGLFNTRLDPALGHLLTPYCEPHRSRNVTTLLMPSPMPFTSTCNALAVATATVCRGLVAATCGVPALRVPPELLHRLMLTTSRKVWDPSTERTLPVVRPASLYAACKSEAACADVERTRASRGRASAAEGA